MAGADAAVQKGASGDSTHERAKSASLVIAIVTVLVGADPLDIRNSHHVFRKVDYIAIGFWILAFLLFLGAQAFPEGKGRRQYDYGKISLYAAMVVAAVAGVLTVTAVGAKALGFADDRDQVLLAVTPAEARALDRLCGPVPLYGSIPTAALNGEFVLLTLRATSLKGCHQVSLPRSEILTIVEDPCDSLDPQPAFCSGSTS